MKPCVWRFGAVSAAHRFASSGRPTPTQNSPNLRFRRCSAKIRPKGRGGAEDAWFSSSDSLALGVADGVGGSAREGVDPAVYATSMMEHCDTAHAHLRQQNASTVNPLEVLQSAYEQTSELHGACTALVAVANWSSELKETVVDVLSVGDCSAIIFREGRLVYETRPQRKGFNYPAQLGMGSGDEPSDGDLTQWADLQEGDIIILSSDGLLDNMAVKEVINTVEKFKREKEPWDIWAQLLCMAAYEVAVDPHAMTPHSLEAAADGHLVGGKLDDITVVIATLEP